MMHKPSRQSPGSVGSSRKKFQRTGRPGSSAMMNDDVIIGLKPYLNIHGIEHQHEPILHKSSQMLVKERAMKGNLNSELNAQRKRHFQNETVGNLDRKSPPLRQQMQTQAPISHKSVSSTLISHPEEAFHQFIAVLQNENKLLRAENKSLKDKLKSKFSAITEIRILLQSVRIRKECPIQASCKNQQNYDELIMKRSIEELTNFYKSYQNKYDSLSQENEVMSLQIYPEPNLIQQQTFQFQAQQLKKLKIQLDILQRKHHQSMRHILHQKQQQISDLKKTFTENLKHYQQLLKNCTKGKLCRRKTRVQQTQIGSESTILEFSSGDEFDGV